MPLEGMAFGRLRPTFYQPRLRLKNYLYRALPPPPDKVDYFSKAPTSLHEILGNDHNGDCTIAAAFHIIDAWIGNAGLSVPLDVLTASACIRQYYHLTGGLDTGLEEQDVLNFWQTTGMLGSYKIAGYVEVNPADEVEVKTALWLFENLYFGVELPDGWLDPRPSEGFTWGMAGAPNPHNGHCFCGLGYDSAGVTIDTWGVIGKISYQAIGYYAAAANQGALYSALSTTAINAATQKAPNGFDFSQLQADLKSFT